MLYIELKMQEYLELKDMTASQAKALGWPFSEKISGGVQKLFPAHCVRCILLAKKIVSLVRKSKDW